MFVLALFRDFIPILYRCCGFLSGLRNIFHENKPTVVPAWQKKLESAQSNLFSKELFLQVCPLPTCLYKIDPNSPASCEVNMGTKYVTKQIQYIYISFTDKF